MTNPTPTKPTIDQILDECDWGYQWKISDVAHNDKMEADFAEEGREERKRLKHQLLQLVLDEVIGKDEINDYTWPDGTYDDKLKNSFREQLRQRAREVFG